MNRDAAIEAGAKALFESHMCSSWDGDISDSTRTIWREPAAAVIDAAAPHLAPDVETLAATLALAYGGHVSPPRGGRDWKAAEAVLATLVPVEDQP